MASAAAFPLLRENVRVHVDIDRLSTRCKAVGYRIASILTDPPTKTRELYYRVKIVEDLNRDASKASIYAKKFFLILKMVGCAFLFLLTTLPGMAIRGIISKVERKPYIYFRSDDPNVFDKQLPENREFTHLNWNICATPGGYAITDGGLVQWEERIDRIADKILSTDADVVNLFEVFDFSAAEKLYEKLKSRYAHFYFNIGAHALGPNSGIFVASKYPIDTPQFNPFSKDTLTPRTKFAEKGIFEYNISSRGTPMMHILATHLQHSEVPSRPTHEEVAGRRMQMEHIQRKIIDYSNQNVMLTGDLNMNDAEFETLNGNKLLKGNLNYRNQFTWGGDIFCKSMLGLPISKGQNLDHTAISNVNGNLLIETSLIETGFNASSLSSNALSDHRGLITKIKV